MAVDAVTGIVCVLGMHRSGTSLVARLLNLLGVDLGPDARVVTAGDDNPKGYWEYRPFVELNDEILARFGGAWNAPPDFPAGWEHDPRLADLIIKARALAAEDFGAAALWGWKDPRACLTLPFWQAALGPMRYVICLRNPAEVSASLARRPQWPVDRPERLWLSHVRATLADTSGHARLFLFYDDLIEDCRPDLRRLADFIGDPARAADPRVLEAVDAFLERELRHHRASLADLVADERLSVPAKSLYVALRACAKAPEPGVQEALPLLGDRAIAAVDRAAALDAEHASLTAERQALVNERDQLAKAQQALVGENQRVSAQRDTVTAERDFVRTAYETLARRHDDQEQALTRAQLEQARLAHDIQQLQIQAQQRDAQIHQLHAYNAHLTAAHAAAQGTIDEIQASVAWRIVSLTRTAIVRLLPAGTARRRLFHALLRRVGAARRSSHRTRQIGVDLPTS